MSGSLAAAGLWVIVATALALLRSRDRPWRAASGLIAVGIPILGWVTYENGPWAGLLALAAGASILRWPLVRLWRRARRKTAG